MEKLLADLPDEYAALAVNKGSVSLHLMPVYGDAKQEQKLRDAFAAASKRLDMGKAAYKKK